jgi:hypothetical protein
MSNMAATRGSSATSPTTRRDVSVGLPKGDPTKMCVLAAASHEHAIVD